MIRKYSSVTPCRKLEKITHELFLRNIVLYCSRERSQITDHITIPSKGSIIGDYWYRSLTGIATVPYRTFTLASTVSSRHRNFSHFFENMFSVR